MAAAAPAPSYSAQFDALFASERKGKGGRLDTRQRLSKPSMEEQRRAPGATLIPWSRRVWATVKRGNWMGREPWSFIDVVTTTFIVGLHLACLAAPFFFTWDAAALGALLFFLVGCCGIDVSFHRQLTHRSFATPKWLEYALALLGTCGLEMDPISWVRHHRFHHQACDTALDPHSPFEGFFWAHAGWLMHSNVLDARAGDDWIVSDLLADPFYRFLQKAYPLAGPVQFALLWWFGGMPAVMWGGVVRQVLMWHVTWLVNSACHVYGQRPYKTGDLSTNCAWLALPTFGESWHNNHHAFPYSARHGLEWWQVDIAWMVIQLFEALGLAHDIRLPTEMQKMKMAAGAAATPCNAVGAGAERVHPAAGADAATKAD